MKYEKRFNDMDMIFHYTKLEIALENILKTKQLRFTKYKDSKDPHENKNRNFSLMMSNMIGDLQFDKKHSNIRAEINKIILNKLRIVCFCFNQENYPGYLRPRMWS